MLRNTLCRSFLTALTISSLSLAGLPASASEIKRINTNEAGYSAVVVASGSKTVSVSGHVAMDHSFNVIGKGDLNAQTEYVFNSLAAALKEAGATPADVVRIRFWVKDFETKDWNTIYPHFVKFTEGHAPASTLIGVDTLFTEDLLIEIDVTAVID